MQLVPIKNILPFSHNKLDKHLFSSKKDLSRVPMFVSQNGTPAKSTNISRIYPIEIETTIITIWQQLWAWPLPETGVVLMWQTVAPAALARASPDWQLEKRVQGDAPSQPTSGRAAEPFGRQSLQGPNSPLWVGAKMTIKRRLKKRENGFL